MSRISIDVSEEQHQKIKAMAALQGKSIKNFVLDRTLNTMDEDNALAELEALLDERIHHAQKEKSANAQSWTFFRKFIARVNV